MVFNKKNIKNKTCTSSDSRQIKGIASRNVQCLIIKVINPIFLYVEFFLHRSERRVILPALSFCKVPGNTKHDFCRSPVLIPPGDQIYVAWLGRKWCSPSCITCRRFQILILAMSLAGCWRPVNTEDFQVYRSSTRIMHGSELEKYVYTKLKCTVHTVQGTYSMIFTTEL